MEALLGVVIGALFASGFFLLLRRRLGHLIIGIGLLTNATNLLVFVASGISRGGAPLIAADASTPPAGSADPLPQALVLTAIVIGFGVLAFFMALAYRAFRSVGTDELDTLITTDRLEGDVRMAASRLASIAQEWAPDVRRTNASSSGEADQ